MLPIYPDEQFTFIGTLEKGPVYKARDWLAIFRVTEFNNQRIRPEELTLVVTDKQKQLLNSVSTGDNLFVKAVGVESDDPKVKNLAFLLDYRLLNHSMETPSRPFSPFFRR